MKGPLATIALQTGILLGRAEGIAYLERVRPEYVWLSLPDARAVAEWLLDHDYRLDVKTETSFVATRSDLPPLAHQ